MISDHNDADFEEKVKQVSVESEGEPWREGKTTVESIVNAAGGGRNVASCSLNFLGLACFSGALVPAVLSPRMQGAVLSWGKEAVGWIVVKQW